MYFRENLAFSAGTIIHWFVENVEFVCRIISVKVSVESFPTGVFLIDSERC